MLKEVRVLDHGYVRLITFTPHNMVGLIEAIDRGSLPDAWDLATKNHDLAEINAARASFAKEKSEIDEKDKGLVQFLADAEPVPHSSPFRHSHVTLEVNAPLIVARQWWRHVVGAATTEEGTPWSELSRRYVRGGIEFHVPEQFRAAPVNAKQGSGGAIDPKLNEYARSWFTDACEHAIATYDDLIAKGIAPEQARMVLPQGIFTTFRWSPSLHALANFLVQREDTHAQAETQTYAEAVRQLVKPLFPLAIEALTRYGRIFDADIEVKVD